MNKRLEGFAQLNQYQVTKKFEVSAFYRADGETLLRKQKTHKEDEFSLTGCWNFYLKIEYE